ncbi:MAG TPA: DUF748 domain-containing protein [Chryseolinea sp.]
MKRWLKILLGVLILLVVFRLILPYVVLRYANKTLAEMDGYYGHVEDIDIALIRGAYQIDSIYINKVDSTTKKQTPFFSAAEIDLSIEWKALFKGSLVGEFVFEKPRIDFTKDKVEPEDVRNDSSSFRQLKEDFMPLQVNRCEINDGEVRYLDPFSKPKVDIKLTRLYAVALNLRNSYDSSSLLPATITANAEVYEGSLDFFMKLNPLADEPTFDMNADLQNTNLVLLNDFFQAYAKIDVNKGRFGMYTEVASKEGRFTGYVKPVIKDLDVLGKEDRDDNIFRKMWEAIAGFAGEVFENQPRDQVATKIPFEGRLDNPQADVWETVINVLQNAFIRAIQPSIDHEITIASVETKKEDKKNFFEKLFGDKDDKKKKKEEKEAKEDAEKAKKESEKKDRKKS